MKIKRILSTALVVLMLFTMVASLIPMTASAAHSPSVSTELKSTEEILEIVKAAYQYSYESAAEALAAELAAGYLESATSPGNKFTIYVNKYTGVLYYMNNMTGQILTSNPYNTEKDFNPNSPDTWGTHRDLLSQIEILFEDANLQDNVTYTSAQWAAELGQIKVSQIADGLRVSYTIGDVSTRYLAPIAITADRFEEKILMPALNYIADKISAYNPDHQTVKDGTVYFIPEGDYDGNPYRSSYGVINRDAVKVYLRKLIESGGAISDFTLPPISSPDFLEKKAQKDELAKIHDELTTLFASRYSEQSIYVTTSQDMINDWAESVPVIADGVVVMKLGYNNNTQLSATANAIKKYCPDYTFDDLYADEAACKYEHISEKKPVFRCALEYSFNNDGSLNVTLPANSITFDDSAYNLLEIKTLKYFGASEYQNDGYIFIPDGSGAVVEFEDFTRKQMSLTLGIYGNDFVYSSLTGHHAEQITMPVYGLVSADPTYGGTGFFAVIESGETLARLNVAFGGAINKYANVYSSYKPRPYDLVEGGKTSYNVVAKTKFTGSFVTRYTMLSGSEASYNGMATVYRNYLEELGVISRLENLSEDLPLYIEALGSMERVDRFLSIPITVDVTLTSFKNVATMYKEFLDAKRIFKEKGDEYAALAEAEEDSIDVKETYRQKAEKYYALADGISENGEIEGIRNIHFKLTGFANGGMYYTYPVKVEWEDAVGGSGGLKSLLKSIKQYDGIDGQVFKIYPEFDFMYINYTEAFDGISNRGNVSKMLDNRYASKYMYDIVAQDFESIYAMVINPNALNSLYSRFLGDYKKYKLEGISVSTLGSDLNSNFDKKHLANRDEAKDKVTALLDRISSRYDVMITKGNIYSVKYASHILELSIDSTHYKYSSYAVPFVGMVLHGYVNYAGTAMNYSGTPAYDLLHAIENGASLYYILGYKNTKYMKEDEDLNKYFGMNYKNWFDSIVESYTELNSVTGDLQGYIITHHTTLVAERVANEKEYLSNLKLLLDEYQELVNDQIRKAFNSRYDELLEENYPLGVGLKLDVDIDSILLAAVAELEIPVDALTGEAIDEDGNVVADVLDEDGNIVENYYYLVKQQYSAFRSQIRSIVSAYIDEFGAASDSDDLRAVVYFGGDSIEYSTKYDFKTDSGSLDLDYDYTDYTVDNHLISMVTYTDPETGHRVRFILNYNIYSVSVSIDENIYTVGKYGYVRIDG